MQLIISKVLCPALDEMVSFLHKEKPPGEAVFQGSVSWGTSEPW